MVTSKCIVLHDTLFSCSSTKYFGNYHVMGPEKVLSTYKFRYCLGKEKLIKNNPKFMILNIISKHFLAYIYLSNKHCLYS